MTWSASAQEVEHGAAQAVEETAAVAEVAVAAEGVGGAFGYLGGLAEGAASGAVKGEGGPVSFGVGSVRRLFLF